MSDALDVALSALETYAQEAQLPPALLRLVGDVTRAARQIPQVVAPHPLGKPPGTLDTELAWREKFEEAKQLFGECYPELEITGFTVEVRHTT